MFALGRLQRRFSTCFLLPLLCAALLVGGGAAGAAAESAVLLAYPPEEQFGVITASTWDERGKRVGDGAIQVERIGEGRVAVRLHGGFADGARIELDSELAEVTVDGRRMLRVLKERSQSHDVDGKPLAIVEIDHEAGKGRCIPPDGDPERIREIDLPSPDRVVNVPLNLLFRPLGTGELERIENQAFFCLGGARVMGFAGRPADDDGVEADEGRGAFEVRYGPDGKDLLSWAARRFAPRISFWMDPEREGAYLAHRMPLYSRGPVVYFIADGVDPKQILSQ